jgi:hypothetical protein
MHVMSSPFVQDSWIVLTEASISGCNQEPMIGLKVVKESILRFCMYENLQSDRPVHHRHQIHLGKAHSRTSDETPLLKIPTLRRPKGKYMPFV